MKRFLLSILCCLMAVVSGYAEEVTISFASTAHRVSQTSAKQVWSLDGVTFTNNKAASTTNVANYSNPVRLYANSQIVVECTSGNITKIVFDCNSTDYATALKNSIGNSATADKDKVTVTLDGTSNSFTVAKLTAQVRMDALTVTYEVSTGVQKPVSPTLTAGGKFVGTMEVEISCATEGATIYYTTDESEPTKESNEYSKSFVITKTTIVKAIAVNEAGESGIATATYTRVATSPEISFDGEATFEDFVEVTIKHAEGTTAYYTLNDKTPTNKSTKYEEPLTIKADATLQVIAYDEDDYASPVVKQAFKKAASGEAGGTATLVEDANDLVVGDKVVIVAAGYNYALSTEDRGNNRGAVDITKTNSSIELKDNVQIITLEDGLVDKTFAFKTDDGYLYAASSTSNYLKTKAALDNNGSWSISVDSDGSASIVANGTYTRNVIRFNNGNSPKIFSCYQSGKQADVCLYKVDLATVEDYVLNVSSAGWATLYLGYNTIIPTGVTCYVISDVTAESAILTKVEGVLPANTGVIVKADVAGEYTFAVTTDESATVENNLLRGTTNNQYIDEEAYVLGMVDGVVGLYMAEMNGGVFLNNANKAYLVPTAQGAKALKFRFDDQTTGINGVATGKKPEVIFDLYGCKVNNATAPGLYIINGKKVMVK